MEAIVCEAYGPVDDLVLRELPEPVPGPGEIRLQISTVGVNFPDALLVRGLYQVKPDLPFVPGIEHIPFNDINALKSLFQNKGDKIASFLAEPIQGEAGVIIPDNDYRGFLKRRVEGLEEKVKGGKFITTDGNIVGTHDGYPFYTIGQRKLGVSLGSDPTYVTGIDPNTNTVTVGTKEDLQKQQMCIKDINYLKYSEIVNGMECLVKVRYKHKGEIATVTNAGDNLKVLFHKKVEGIAPGQSAAIYEGQDLIAGGFIMKK